MMAILSASVPPASITLARFSAEMRSRVAMDTMVVVYSALDSNGSLDEYLRSPY